MVDLKDFVQPDDEHYNRLEKVIVDLAQNNNNKNPKSLLQEFCQKNHLKLPIYKVVNREGPNHSPTYIVEVSITPSNNIKTFQKFFKDHDGTIIGKGKNKKLAEIYAAKRMCKVLGLVN